LITAGIDGGSRAIKVLLLDAAQETVLASGTRDQGVEHERLAADLYDELLKQRGLQHRDVARIVATGYTRNGLTFAHASITEITCHACGVHHLAPEARTVIEIGGQDSKLLKLNADGSVRDFAMNDRCAAGTGRFLEVVAARLDTTLDGLGELAAGATRPAAISSMCVVFAETEIIGLLASGMTRENIVAGVQSSVATRVASMAGRSVTPPVYFTGGVARIPGMAKALEGVLNQPVQVCPEPLYTGALGAAILAGRQAQGARQAALGDG
jgi:predicted CoA-substrate-specific enzyme activase